MEELLEELRKLLREQEARAIGWRVAPSERASGYIEGYRDALKYVVEAMEEQQS